MAFVPRRSVPAITNLNYLHNSCGGLNYCILRYNGTVLPNCVGYAWGRFMEILGSTPKLSRGDAGTWYGNTSDGYTRSSKPQLGAVACWAKPGAAGHVAIVEQINSDGSIVISQSGYSRSWEHRFWIDTVPKSGGNYILPWSNGNSYIFQGFIYNPACASISNKRDDFLKLACSHLGTNGDWAWATSGLARGNAWCAAFIYACAKTVGGLLNVIIPATYVVGDMPRIGVPKRMGTWIPGPNQGRSAIPQPGDFILFRWQPRYRSDIYHSDHIGIVREVTATKVLTVEGNSNDRVRYKEYLLTNTCINGYYRPNWSQVGADSTISVDNTISGQLYTSETTRNDAMIREVAYINSANQPSITTSNIKLSVINYTGALGNMFEYLVSTNGGLAANGVVAGTGTSTAPTGSSGTATSTVIVNGLSSGPKAVVEFFMSKGLTAAAGVGVAANIRHESNFKTGAKGDYRNGVPTSFGICQWHNERGTKMKQMASPDWANNMTGQLNYLWYELTKVSTYSQVLSTLRGVSNNEAGARKAADVFVRKFEVPANVNNESQKRQSTASEYWKQIVPQLKST